MWAVLQRYTLPGHIPADRFARTRITLPFDGIWPPSRPERAAQFRRVAMNRRREPPHDADTATSHGTATDVPGKNVPLQLFSEYIVTADVFVTMA